MTNKMPVVGQRYNHKEYSNIFCIVDGICGDKIYSLLTNNNAANMLTKDTIKDFWREFEELPTSNSQKAEEVRVEEESESEYYTKNLITHLKIVTKEDIAAMDKSFHQNFYNQLWNFANNLVKALEAEKNKPLDTESVYDRGYAVGFRDAKLEIQNDMSKPEPKIDMKEERVEPVSIWKDVNEEIDDQSIIFVNKAGYARLAEYWNDKIYFIEGDSGDVRAHCIDKNYYGKKYCTLTDFVNSFEQMQKDIEELKRLVTVLLQAVDSWPSDGILLAATNHPELLDSAIWRRFDKIINFPKPNASQQESYISKLLELPASEKQHYLFLLSSIYQDLSYAEIEKNLNSIQREVVIENITLKEGLDRHIARRVKDLDSESRLSFARLLNDKGCSQRKIQELTGCSRDTLRIRKIGTKTISKIASKKRGKKK